MIKIMEYRKPFQPKYEYFAHFNIKLNDYDSEAEDNLFDLVQSLFDCYESHITAKGIDFIIHSDNMSYLTDSYVMDMINEYSDPYNDAYTFTVNSLSIPNVYKDDEYYWIESNELLSKEQVSEMWSNSFVGYEDYDDNYPTTLNAFVRQCVNNGKMKLVQWIDGRD